MGNEIGVNIRKIRKEKGLTQKQLAIKTDIAEITIRQYENGKFKPKFDNVLKICHALNVNTWDILGWNGAEEWAEDEKRRLSLYNASEAYQEKLKQYYNLLNSTGQQVAVERVEELTHIEKYTKKETEDM